MNEGQTAEGVWAILQQVDDQFAIQGANIDNNTTQNSNSYANTILKIVGISIAAHIEGATPNDVQDGFPGSRRNLLNGEEIEGAPVEISLNLDGNETVDILRTGDGKDTLLGNGGNDLLSAGSNDDFLFGGEGNDELRGGEGADELRGDAGDDTLYFDAEDTVVDGGEGRDTALVEGTDGVTLNLESSSIEVAIGGVGFDEFTANANDVSFMAGGDLGDVFNIDIGSTGTAIVWGGEGADKIQLTSDKPDDQAGILVVDVTNLTEDNFQTMTLDDFGLGPGFNWDEIDVVHLNPDSTDTVAIDGRVIDLDTHTEEVYAFAPSTGAELVWTFSFQADVGSSQSPSPEAVEDMDVDFLGIQGQATASVQTNAIRVSDVTLQVFIDENGDEYLDGEVYNFEDWVNKSTYDFASGLKSSGDPDVDDYYFLSWIVYEAAGVSSTDFFDVYLQDGAGVAKFDDYSTFLQEVGTISNPSDLGTWFVHGGTFDGKAVSSNGSITITLDDPETPDGSEDIGDQTELNVQPGSGNKSFTGFQPTSSVIVVSGVVVDPGAPLLGVTVSQQNSSVVITYGENDTITLLDVSLADWQAAALTQVLGTSSDETLTGTNDAEVLAGGAGNDTFYASHGDDTIIYHSGDDRITNRNDGFDTLDLSKYVSDEVQFASDGSNLIITTPDGQIQVDSQFSRELGSVHLNIDKVVFSDNELDEAAILNKAMTDQSTSGDDIVKGTRFDDVLIDGAGNDTYHLSYGDDTIAYHSGDDLIAGQHNRGNDTLDLSKYSADQVTFSKDSRYTLIDTPDGQIKLDYQNYYDIGDMGTTIENILFSDGSLDQLGIRFRAINDTASSGNDVLVGTNFADTLVGGLGDDILTGDGGQDQFVFRTGEGDDHITDFEDGLDILRLEGAGLSFSDLVVTDSSDGAVIDLAGQGTITLAGINSALISADDFQFV